MRYQLIYKPRVYFGEMLSVQAGKLALFGLDFVKLALGVLKVARHGGNGWRKL
jgi:hypothetical protein